MTIWHDLQWVVPLRTPALTQLAFALSWLGYTTFIMFFMAIGYWTWNKVVFFRLLILVAANALINAYAKDWIQDPRPPLDIRLDDLVGASYGLPSGHAQLAVVMWLWLAWEMRRLWVWVLCTLIAVSVMASRMYLGVHDLEDVLGGAALGGISLLVFEALRHQKMHWQSSLGWSTALIALVTTVALWTWPGGTAPEYIPTLAGWLIAAICGLQIDQRYIGIHVPSVPWQRIAVAVLGAACFMGEQKLLKIAGTYLALEPALWALIKGLVNGSCVSLLIPWAMQAFRLTTSSPPTQTIQIN